MALLLIAHALGGLARRTRIDGDFHRHAGHQSPARFGSDIDGYPHRHALDDLGKITSRVLRRQNGELRTRSRCDALDPAVQFQIWKRIDLDFYGLAGAHQSKLRLLEVRRHVEAFVGHERHQPGRRLDKLSLAHSFVPDPAVCRGPQDCGLNVGLRGSQPCLRGVGLCQRLLFLRAQGSDVVLCAGE